MLVVTQHEEKKIVTTVYNPINHSIDNSSLSTSSYMYFNPEVILLTVCTLPLRSLP